MKSRIVIILIIILVGFLASRVRFEPPTQPDLAPAPSPNTSLTTPREHASTQNTSALFNLAGEWRGVLEPLHGNYLDPRDWKLELKFLISGEQAHVYIRRGEDWQEVKPGKFRISRHKTNAIIHSIDSGGGWVESWIFSISRYDQDSINVYGNRIINNFKQPAESTSARITYAATARFKRVYERHRTVTTSKSTQLNDEEIARQIQEAIERGKRLADKQKHGNLKVLEHRVTHETNDSAVLMVKYEYDGLSADEAWISALTFNEGKSTGYWSFRPVKLHRGKRAAHIHIGMASQSPDSYCSDNFVIQAYVPNAGNFFEQAVPYQRCWSRTTQ